MKKLLALVLSLLLVASCLAMSVSAEDTTEEDTAKTNTVLTFNSEALSMKALSGNMGISKPICNSAWEGVRLKLTDVEDPYVTIQWSKYLERAGLEQLDAASYPYIVFKLLVEGYVDDIEIFYCAGDVTAPDPSYSTLTDYPCESSGEIEYIIYDLSDDGVEGLYNSFRFDPMGADEGTVIYLCEMAFFATEDEAFVYAGYGDDNGDGEDGEGEATQDDETESVEETEEQTEATTEKKTEKETTKAQKTEKETEAAAEGCGGIISIGAVVAMISLGIVCIKKKD